MHCIDHQYNTISWLHISNKVMPSIKRYRQYRKGEMQHPWKQIGKHKWSMEQFYCSASASSITIVTSLLLLHNAITESNSLSNPNFQTVIQSDDVQEVNEVLFLRNCCNANPPPSPATIEMFYEMLRRNKHEGRSEIKPSVLRYNVTEPESVL